jgi:SAM-dependent methyltransferase
MVLPAENIYGHTKKLRFLLRNLAEVRSRRVTEVKVLDFGCGNAVAVSRYLMQEGVQYFGVDIHEPSLAFARANFGGPKACFTASVPSDVVFDIIIYADNLEHLDDPLAFMTAHTRQLATDGVILGAVPNGYGPFENERRIDRFFHLSETMDRLITRLRTTPASSTEQVPYNHDSGHVQFFTRRSLQQLLRAAGLAITEFENGSFIGAPLSERLLLRGERIANLNTRIASLLPAWAVSTWYFRAERLREEGRN